MNIPLGDRSCGRVKDVAVEGPVSIGVVSVGVVTVGCAGGTTASGAASPGAGAGASIAGTAPGCSWAAAPPANRMTDASKAANKPFLDKGFFLILTVVSLHIADRLAGDGVRKHAHLDTEIPLSTSPCMIWSGVPRVSSLPSFSAIEQRPLADGEPYRFDMEGSLGMNSSHGLGLSWLRARISKSDFRRRCSLTMKHEFTSQQ
ncbi:hypothetical protein [Mesorhizobium sp. AA22]|uniref:hypothetical protein n=1 Tax=Mesorhizobium sp. AA22 TaxID=1854057 RepID=UPI001FED30E3|nr:hypothetical protein [Mesorhizobium sp. AA22]